MQNPSTKSTSSAVPAPPITLNPLTSRPTRTLTKILLVQFRNGEAVHKHPELRPYMDDGWTIRSAVPRIVESQGTRLLVVMAKPDPAASHLKRIK